MEQTAIRLSEVVAKALKLSVKERLQLIEQVAVSVRGEITPLLQSKPTETEGHWGRDMAALLATLDMHEWEDIEDPVEWLKQQREAQLKQRLGDWSIAE